MPLRKNGKPQRQNGGRKSEYTPKIKSAIVALVREGKREYEVVDILKISRPTLSLWKKKDKSLSIEIDKARDFAKNKLNDVVESAMFKRATGYMVEEKTVEKYINDKGSEVVRQKIAQKNVAPDVAAQIFWLKNKRPDEWVDRREIVPSGNNNFAEWVLKQEIGEEDEE